MKFTTLTLYLTLYVFLLLTTQKKIIKHSPSKRNAPAPVVPGSAQKPPTLIRLNRSLLTVGIEHTPSG